MSRKSKWDIYVLIRVYNGYLDKGSVVEKEHFWTRLAHALDSVQSNANAYSGMVYLLINDDTPHIDGLYDSHCQRLNRLLHDKAFIENKNLFFTDSPGGERSAAATYRIRKSFVAIASRQNQCHTNVKALAVSLDQDDELRNRALIRIARHMQPNGVVLSKFVVKDENKLDITKDQGRSHNRISRFLSCPRWIRKYLVPRRNRIDWYDTFIEEESGSDYYWRRKWQKRIKDWRERRHVYCDKHFPVRDIIYASTLGWTKSYSWSVMERYLQDLDSFFMTKMNPGKDIPADYFKAHPAYEDFLDFYVLLYADVKLAGTLFKTHRYIKRSDSITSTPSLEAFRDHRTASLINLVDLTFYFGCRENYLRSDYQYKLLRHVLFKVSEIEGILKKYRDDYDAGDDDPNKAQIAKYTHEGYFVNKLCRLVEGDHRTKNAADDELFNQSKWTRSERTLDNFTTLFRQINKIREYVLHLKGFSLRYYIKKGCRTEEGLKAKKALNEENIAEKYDRNLTPKQRQSRSAMRLIISLPLVFAAIIAIFGKDIFQQDNAPLIAGIFSVFVAILTFLLNERSKLRTMAMEEASQKKLYYSEFEDLIRHLAANMKIIMQLRKDMLEKRIQKPSDIHFNNLKWPSGSCLFSDEMAKIIDKDKVDDFARLRVNLRNINNSALWLQRYTKDPAYNKKKMLEMMEWELTRYFGYYINFMYLKDNGFSFPNPHQLDVYLADKAVRHKLALLFMAETPEESVSLVHTFVKRYNDDRREKRSVLEA
ncbi:MAG: hypothetical protein IJQ69_04110 [Bacteroidales bacterium]|nr:hypothetical protein [Bacteroidales bacterium]